MRLVERIKTKYLHNEVLKKEVYTIIFESDTPKGKLFDEVLILVIIASILLVMVESIQGLPNWVELPLKILEYVFTFIFTLEYLLRIYCSPQPRKYVLSFFGIVDLLSTLPLYISWIFGSARYLLIIRTFRLIRVFRVFKMFSFLSEGNMLLRSLADSSRKIAVFFLFVVIMVISIGTIMYMVENGSEGTSFDNIPNSIYWAIVTMTTVGYGDITPVTGIGKFLSAVVMLLGYTIIAVPTGIVSATMMGTQRKRNDYICPHCGKKGHDERAIYCKFCGERIVDNDGRLIRAEKFNKEKAKREAVSHPDSHQG